MNKKLDGRAIGKTLTGFDEIAIEKYFLKELAELSESSAVRALLFVVKRRDGMGDQDAFKASMQTTLGELHELFKTAEDAVVEGDEESGEA